MARTAEQIAEARSRVENYGWWYHKIDLGDGIVTPGREWDALWNNARSVLDRLNFAGKTVCDIGAWDGMWSFEAESRGAKTVVATDTTYRFYERLLWVREQKQSKIIPFYNVGPYQLFDRLDIFLQESYGDERPFDRLFDIVLHFGVLYHLQDPMRSLAQARSIVKPGGLVVIETPVLPDETRSVMEYNGNHRKRLYPDCTTWWIPSLSCLKEMCEACMLELTDNFSVFNAEIPRHCIVARAVDGSNLGDEFLREVLRPEHNPALQLPSRPIQFS
jgi:tRNA (mo5U34)-methyltransferase